MGGRLKKTEFVSMYVVALFKYNSSSYGLRVVSVSLNSVRDQK